MIVKRNARRARDSHRCRTTRPCNAQNLRQIFYRNLVRTIGERPRRIFVHLHEDSITPGGHRRARQDRRQDAVAGCCVAGAPRPLHGMSRVENHAISRFPNPGQGPHIGDEIVIAKRRSAFREHELCGTELFKFLRNILYFPGSEKLPFFHVHGSARFRRRSQQIGLATKKCRDLQKIDKFPRHLRLAR